jgi:hypothetical protein
MEDRHNNVKYSKPSDYYMYRRAKNWNIYIFHK